MAAYTTLAIFSRLKTDGEGKIFTRRVGKNNMFHSLRNKRPESKYGSTLTLFIRIFVGATGLKVEADSMQF